LKNYQNGKTHFDIQVGEHNKNIEIVERKQQQSLCLESTNFKNYMLDGKN
jgi:hypothetical protein